MWWQSTTGLTPQIPFLASLPAVGIRKLWAEKVLQIWFSVGRVVTGLLFARSPNVANIWFQHFGEIAQLWDGTTHQLLSISKPHRPSWQLSHRHLTCPAKTISKSVVSSFGSHVNVSNCFHFWGTFFKSGFNAHSYRSPASPAFNDNLYLSGPAFSPPSGGRKPTPNHP